MQDGDGDGTGLFSGGDACDCDADNDGLVESGEPAIAALWQGNNGTVDMRMYAYQPDDPAGDPLVDADGYADGITTPGGAAWLVAYEPGGLLSDITDPDGYPWEVAHAPFLELTPDGQLNLPQ